MSLIDQFLEFENQNKLFDKKINGIEFWHLCRFKIYKQIVKEHGQLGEAQSVFLERHLFKKIVRKVFQLKYCFLYHPLILLKKSDVLIFNHQRRVRNGEYYDCLYTDALIKELDHSYTIFEEPYLGKHYRPIKNKNIKYTDYFQLKFGIVYFFCSKELDSKDKKYLEEIIDKINSIFEVNLKYEQWIKKISKIIYNYIYQYKYYVKIIEKTKPKVIIEVVAYTANRFLINQIAKEKNIPTIELQHGTMGKYHVAYNFTKKLALSTLPEYMFLFGDFWKDNSRLPLDEKKIRVVGWPYYEKKVNNYKINENRGEIKVILFISQGIIGKELSKIAVQLSKKIEGSKYKIIYKLHPGEYDRWKKEYRWLIEGNIKVIDHNNHDIHYYLSQANIQVGVYSTALYEGLGYGLETYVCRLYGYEFMEELYKNNKDMLVESADDLLKKIEKDKNRQFYNESSYFWKKNSMKNMIKEIEAIISKEN